jgi:hypothetical protein
LAKSHPSLFSKVFFALVLLAPFTLSSPSISISPCRDEISWEVNVKVENTGDDGDDGID